MALIPPFFVDCVVAIGIGDAEGKRTWVASGFLYGYLIGGADKKGYRVYLVTNRHVFEKLSKVYIRFNPQADEQARDFELDLKDQNGRLIWLAHPDPEVDVAVVPTNFAVLIEQGLQVGFFQNDQHVAPIEKMRDLGLTEGDFAYVLGFPMGLVGERRNAVVVRSGSIARIRDVLGKTNKQFLVDAFVFPGNSGGPVILRPEAIAIQGTQPHPTAYLIGVVQSYLTYEEAAVSVQTRRTRVVFEENSGLAAAHPVDFIDETIQVHLKALADQAPQKPKGEEKA
jgi:S1-C subfamily serine protease